MPSTGSLSEITEVSANGVVPELRVVNRGLKPTLIIDGEELVGAKQNRVVNLTILVAAESELIIPVSCVEAGRWRAKSSRFATAPRTQYATGRAKRMAQVSRSMAHCGDRASDQSAVWADIADKSARMHSSSSTSAMEQIFTDHAASIDAYVTGLAPVDGQIGALFAIGDHIVGFDLFDDAGTFRKLLPKLVRSYAVDAIDMANGSTLSATTRQARGAQQLSRIWFPASSPRSPPRPSSAQRRSASGRTCACPVTGWSVRRSSWMTRCCI